MLRTITTAAELSALRSRRERRGVERVVLQLIPHPNLRAKFEVPINRYIASCGCGTGAVFVAAGLFAFVPLFFRTPGPFGFVRSAQTLGILLILGLVGKVVGLLNAEYRLRRVIGVALSSLGATTRADLE
jgi:hypothetical protein